MLLPLAKVVFEDEAQGDFLLFFGFFLSFNFKKCIIFNYGQQWNLLT